MKKKRIIITSGIIVILILGIIGGVKYNNQKKISNFISESDRLIMEEKYGEAEQVLIQAQRIKNNEELTKKLELLNSYKTQNEIYENANKLIKKKEYDKAIKELNKVDAKAGKINKKVSEKITFCKNEMIKSKIAVLEKYLSENKFNDTYKVLNEINTIDSSNKQAVGLKAKIDNAKINYEKEQKRIQEEKSKKPLTVGQARNLAIDVYFKKNPDLKEKPNLKKGICTRSDEEIVLTNFEGMYGYHIQLLVDMKTHVATLAWYFVDINSGKVYETIAGTPPAKLIN